MRLFLFILFVSFQCLAESRVDFQLRDGNNNGTYDEPYFWTATSDGGCSGYKEIVANDMSSEGGTATIYVPYDMAGTTNFNRLGTCAPTKNVLSVLKLNVLVTNAEGASTKLWIAFREEDDAENSYKVLTQYGGTIGYPTTRESMAVAITLDDGTSCFNKDSDCLLSETDKVYYFYIFQTLDTVDFLSGATIEPGSYPNGASITMNMGKPTFDTATAKGVLTKITKGDSRLYLGFNSGTYDLDIHYHRTIVQDGGAEGDDYDTAATNSRVLSPIYRTDDSGTLTVTSLTNDRLYNLSIAFVDKFNYATKFSNVLSETPKDIEEFLREQACYLVSAGFGRSHYIIDYFKNFRDRVLLKSKWGTRFVKFYYRTAPDMALVIYRNPLLRGCFRAGSYLLYFCFQYVGFVMALAFLLGVNYILVNKKRLRI